MVSILGRFKYFVILLSFFVSNQLSLFAQNPVETSNISVTLESIKITPFFSILGASYVVNSEKKKVDCDQDNSTVVGISYVHLLDLGKAESLKKCLSPQSRKLLEGLPAGFVRKSKKERLQLYGILDLSSEKRLLAEKIVKIKKRKQAYRLEKFLKDAEQIFDKFDSQVEKNNHLYGLLKKAKGIQNNIIVDLYRATIFYMIGNVARAEKMIDRILSINPLIYIYYIDEHNLDEDEIWGNLIKLLKYIRLNIADKNVFKMLTSYYRRYLNDRSIEVKKQYEANFDASWSLIDIRSIIESPNFGHNFVRFWFYELRKRASRNEVILFLRKAIDESLIRRSFYQIAPIFENYFPEKDKLRLIILKKIKKYIYSPRATERELGILMLSNPDIYEAFTKKIDPKIPPLYRLKRDHYRKNLRKGIAIKYSLYHLINIGDQAKEYLLWAAIR